MKKYSIIYADFPWKYNDRRNTHTRFCGGAMAHYPVMGMSEIKTLNIPDIANDNCALFLWCTFPQLDEQIKLFSHWGFKYVTQAFTWVKTNTKNGKPFFGIGYYTKCLEGSSVVYIKNKHTGEVSSVTLQSLYGILNYADYYIHTPNGWRGITSMQKNKNTEVTTISTPLDNLVVSLNHKLFYKKVSTQRYKKSDKRKTIYSIACDEVTEIRRKWKLGSNKTKGSTNLLFSKFPVVSETCVTNVNSIELTDDIGWLLGLFCAEGNYGNANGSQIRFTLNANETEFADKIKHIVSSLNMKGDRYFNSTISANIHYPKETNAQSIYFSSALVKSVIQYFISGEGAHFKRLNTHNFLNTSLGFRMSFLQGMFDGDGFLEQGKYQRVTLCNEGLRNDLRKVAHSVGIPTYAYKGNTTLNGKVFYNYGLGVIYRGKQMDFEGSTAQAIEISNFSDPFTTDTYDLSVDGEVFIVNDLISHNSNTEVCLLGIRGKMKPVSNSVSSVIIAPRERHSKKPDIVRDKIVELFGDLPRIELFARPPLPTGWDCLGNDIDGTDIRTIL